MEKDARVVDEVGGDRREESGLQVGWLFLRAATLLLLLLLLLPFF